MTNPHPPRVALWLLERFAPDNEPLIGDLVEQFSTNSRWWFWRQVLAAVVMARLHRSREIRPLKLVDREPGEVTVSPALERRTINLTASPLHGVGGLGLLALAVLISVVAPEMWLIVIAVLFESILFGLAWISVRPRKAHSGYAGFLFRSDGEVPDRTNQPNGRS